MSDNVRAHQERESIMTKTSRFNYIKHGLVGVCAATMLTGLCAGAAFAVEPPTIDVPSTASTIQSGGTATTAVKAQAETAQISATVPTTVTASVDSTGTLTFPDNTKFVITATNDSWPVKVSGLSVAVADGYTLADTPAASKEIGLSIGSTPLKAADNTSAISELKQTAAGSDPIKISMSGSLYQPSYADVTSSLSIATLTWTLSAY